MWKYDLTWNWNNKYRLKPHKKTIIPTENQPHKWNLVFSSSSLHFHWMPHHWLKRLTHIASKNMRLGGEKQHILTTANIHSLYWTHIIHTILQCNSTFLTVYNYKMQMIENDYLLGCWWSLWRCDYIHKLSFLFFHRFYFAAFLPSYCNIDRMWVWKSVLFYTFVPFAVL